MNGSLRTWATLENCSAMKNGISAGCDSTVIPALERLRHNCLNGHGRGSNRKEKIAVTRVESGKAVAFFCELLGRKESQE